MKLNAVGLRGARDLMPSEVSGGMARRVALARAIALDPDLIMYDEPFAGLDPISLGTAARLIRQLNDTLGITSIVVSHDLEETFRIADQVIVLANGKRRGAGHAAKRCATPPIRWSTSSCNAKPDGPVHFHYPGPTVAEDFGGGFKGMSWYQSSRRRLTRRARKLADLGHGARLFLRLVALFGRKLAALRPGARPDPFPGQLFAGDHRGVGPVRRLRAGPAGLLHACSATARPRRWACWWR